MAKEVAYKTAWLWVAWWAIYPGTAILLGRQLYEQTYLTWKSGPQMIGFSFVHFYPLLFLFDVLSMMAAHVWLLAVVITLVRQRGRLCWHRWVQAGLTVATLAIDYVPTEAWQRGMVLVLGVGS